MTDDLEALSEEEIAQKIEAEQKKLKKYQDENDRLHAELDRREHADQKRISDKASAELAAEYLKQAPNSQPK